MYQTQVTNKFINIIVNFVYNVVSFVLSKESGLEGVNQDDLT